jgi:hypothetical protein
MLEPAARGQYVPDSGDPWRLLGHPPAEPGRLLHRHDLRAVLVGGDLAVELPAARRVLHRERQRTATLTGVPVGTAKTYSMTFSATLGTAATTQKFTLTTTG